MREFKIGDQGYQLITSWNEVTLKQYLAITKIQTETLDLSDILVLIRLFEILCDVKEGDLDELDIDQMNELGEELQFLNETPTYNTHSYLEIDGINYVFPTEMNKLTLGEVASINILKGQAKKDITEVLPSILAVLIRPGYKKVDELTGKETWKREKFNAETINDRAELFKNRFRMVDLMGVYNFFLSLSNTSPTSTQSYSSPLPHQRLM